MKKQNIFLLITSLIWGFNFVAQHLAMDSMGPMFFSFLRFAVAFITMLIVVLIRHKKTNNIKAIKAGLICGLCLFFASVLQQVGLVYTLPGKAGFISTLYVIFVPILSFLFYREKPTLKMWIGVVIALIGLYLLTFKSDVGFTSSDFTIFLSAILYAVHIILIDNFADDVDVYEFNLVQFLVVALFSLIGVFAIKENTVNVDLKAAIPMLLYSGALSTSIAYTTQTLGQVDNDPTIASLIMSLESVFATLGGYLVLHNILSTTEMFGCLLIFVSIIYVQLPGKKK